MGYNGKPGATRVDLSKDSYARRHFIGRTPRSAGKTDDTPDGDGGDLKAPPPRIGPMRKSWGQVKVDALNDTLEDQE